MLSGEVVGERRSRRSFALVVRGEPEDFQWLLDQARIVGLYVVYSKSSTQRLVVKEEGW